MGPEPRAEAEKKARRDVCGPSDTEKFIKEINDPRPTPEQEAKIKPLANKYYELGLKEAQDGEDL